MRVTSLLVALAAMLTMVTASYAGPTTNLEEYKGDKLLTKDQQAEFQKLLDQGVKHYENGQYDDAEKDFKQILTFAPKKNLAYFNLGLTKYKQGDYKAAISYFDTVVKKRSYYVGAAFYYKAISQLNLEQQEDASKTAKRFTPARFFYGPSQNLIKSIKAGTDEYYDNAKAAFADENFELCLLEMDESVFSDTAKGKELTQKCKNGMVAEEPVAAPTLVDGKIPNRHTIWFNAKYMHTDNVYEEATNVVKKYLYNFNFGAEYIVAAKVDYGIGVSYDHSNAVDLPNFKDELYNVYVPFFYRRDSHRYSAELFYNNSKFNGSDAWSEAGALANYFYSQEKYVVGVIATASTKTALTSAFDYKSGPFTSARVTGTRYLGDWTLNAFVGMDQNLAGDQPLFGNFIPYANKSTRFGLGATYALTEKAKLNLRGNSISRDYLNVVSALKTDRSDTTTNLSLGLQYQFNKNVRAYIEQAYVNNDSNYGPKEVLDRNYKENITTLGVNLVAY